MDPHFGMIGPLRSMSSSDSFNNPCRNRITRLSALHEKSCKHVETRNADYLDSDFSKVATGTTLRLVNKTAIECDPYIYPNPASIGARSNLMQFTSVAVRNLDEDDFLRRKIE